MNLERKFWSCENQSCNLTFEWIEDEVPERSRRIISGLLNAKANLELQVEKSKKKRETSLGCGDCTCTCYDLQR